MGTSECGPTPRRHVEVCTYLALTFASHALLLLFPAPFYSVFRRSSRPPALYTFCYRLFSLGSFRFQVKEMVPDMELAQRCWVAVTRQDPAAAAGVLATIKERNMGPWYASLCQQHPSLFPADAALSASMKEANDAEKARISEVRWLCVCVLVCLCVCERECVREMCFFASASTVRTVATLTG